MEAEQVQELWQVDAGGKVYEANFAEMTEWINEGSLLRIDRVRKGNLRWIEAGKVPALLEVFNALETGDPAAPVITLTKLGPGPSTGDPAANPPNFTVSPVQAVPTTGDDPVCSTHPEAAAFYICETCGNTFCKACPSSYGGTVKICPYCGAMCKPIVLAEKARVETAVYAAAIGEGFGVRDFARALAYPFKFKTSLIMGALMFAFFSIGQGAMSFGGIFMLGSTLVCFMLANTLTFGILANTVENFSQGDITSNFMPTFEDFSLWDDVIHPFFLSIGVYIASFGPVIAVGLVAVFFVSGSMNPANKEMNGLQSDAARTVAPDLPYAANAARQSEEIKKLLNKQKEDQKQRIATIEGEQKFAENGEAPPANGAPAAVPAPPVEDTEAGVERANQMIQQQQKAKLESVVGKTPETKAQEQAALIQQILGFGSIFLVLGGLSVLWGILYFPAACAVAGYTRSFMATLNPSFGFDTIRRLGRDYFKILLMGLGIVLMSGAISIALSTVLSPFDLPGVGNVAARAIGSIFGFYFSVV
ncbi:MAG: hypothetical protein ABJB40_07290, partial [Acidobacteriota bacterium]